MTDPVNTVMLARDDLGLIRIAAELPAEGAPEPGDALYLSTLPVPGAIIQIDVRESAGLRLLVDSPEAADWWLEQLLGEAVSEAVLELGKGEQTRTTAVVEQTALAGSVRRMMTLLWLRRWWPAPVGDVPPVHEWLIDAELGALAWDASELFGSLEFAGAVLEPHSDSIRIVLEGVLAAESSAEVANDPIASVVRAAARAALDSIDPAATGYDELERSYVELVHREREAGRAVETTAPATRAVLEQKISAALATIRQELSELFAAPAFGRSELALAAGVADDAAVARRFYPGIDWRRVHPRSADAAGNAAVVEVVPDAHGTAVLVQVSAETATLPDPGGLLATVSAAGAEPADVLLELADGVWAGTAQLAAGIDPETVVVELDGSLIEHPPTALGSLSAAQVRDAVIGHIADRWGMGTRDFAFEHAADAREGAAVLPFRTPIAQLGPRQDFALAAATGDGPRAEEAIKIDGIELRRGGLSQTELHLTLAADPGRAQPLDIGIVTTSGDEGTFTVLIPLTQREDGSMAGGAAVPAGRASLSVELQQLPQPLGELDPALADSVGSSVRAASPTERQAWIAAARELAADHPLRAAVLSGLE